MDLGLLPTVAASASREQLRKLNLISNVDFTRVKGRMNVDYPTSPELMDQFELEVKRFLALIAFDDGGRHVASEKIDTMWHYFVLHTVEYRRFCKETFGVFIEHVPILPCEKPTLAKGYAHTKDRYAQLFGPPSPELWGRNDQICWGDCDEIKSEEPLLN